MFSSRGLIREDEEIKMQTSFLGGGLQSLSLPHPQESPLWTFERQKKHSSLYFRMLKSAFASFNLINLSNGHLNLSAMTRVEMEECLAAGQKQKHKQVWSQ